jgi:SanA protein
MKRRSRRWHAIFWPSLVVGLLAVLLGLAIIVPNLMITQGAKAYIVQSVREAPHAQCAIVLGARVHTDGTPYPMFQDRLDTAIALYQAGKVEKLLLSGDNRKPAPYKEVDLMFAYVLARGVAEEDVFTDYAGYDTYDSMYRAHEVFQVDTILIPTQDFHLSRAVYLARQLGLDATGVVADIQVYTDESKNAARELLARVKAVLRLFVTHAAPVIPDGGPYPITGDGRRSRPQLHPTI